MANRNVQLRMLGIDLLELLRRIAGIREDKGCAVKARVLQARQRFPGCRNMPSLTPRKTMGSATGSRCRWRTSSRS